MIEKLGGRKLLKALIILVVGAVFAGLKGDIPPNLLHLLEVVFAGYVCGNVGTQIVGAVTAKFEPKTAPVSQQQQDPRIDALAESVATTQQGVSYLVDFVAKAQSRPQ